MSRLMRLVYILFVVCMSIFVMLSLTYLKRQNDLNRNVRQFEHSNDVLLQIEQINGILNANGSMLRTMLILGNKKLWPDVLVANEVMLGKADSLIRLTAAYPEQMARAVEIRKILEERYKLIRDEVPIYSNSNIQHFIENIGSLRKRYDSIYSDYAQTEMRSISKIREKRDRFDKLTTPALTILLIFSSVFLLAIFLFLVLTLKKRIFFQNELQAKIRTLNLANRELENLSRVTSHHIQEPMRKIRNFSTLLEKKLDLMPKDEMLQIIGKIEGNAGSLQVLAQNLVQYANLIQDNKPKEKLDLNQLVDDVIFKLEDLIFETKTVISRENLPNLDAIPHQVFILFVELIRNSISFAKPGQVPMIEILQVAPSNPGLLTVAVKDHGIGFSNDYAERIFRIFEQLEPRSAPGKGIGLAMCSRIMLNHGGRIRAEGIPDSGATFYLDFPV